VKKEKIVKASRTLSRQEEWYVPSKTVGARGGIKFEGKFLKFVKAKGKDRATLKVPTINRNTRGKGGGNEEREG